MLINREMMTRKEKQLFRKIIWFDKRAKFDIDFFELLQPQRVVSSHPHYRSGLFYSEKCKREIQYESAKELAFIKWLESSKRVLFYYEQPVQVPYWRGRRKQTYTPDFGVYLDTKEFVLVEVKELAGMLEEKVQFKIEGLMSFCYERGFGLLLTDGKETLDKVRNVKCNRKLEKDILKSVENSMLRKTECNELIRKHGASQKEFLKIILKNNLTYRAYPFKLKNSKNRSEVFRQVFIEKKKYNDLLINRYPTLFKETS